ncbi:MAG: hypothetical protein QY318_01990 [Candidatus Dojkabacteria bacterium]|nr:MAG: hypothetical protein QY318_01990 [Candidatus Dojkabacteria bacterium]
MENNDKTHKNSNNLNGSASNSKKKYFIDTVAKFCDRCGTEYGTDDVHIVQESNFSSIIHFSCSNCKSNHIATFIRPMGMSSRVPVNCDLLIDEIGRFAKLPKISSDEVLDLFAQLEEIDRAVSF